MNIVYTVDDRFVPQLAASICSVCVNNKSVDNIVFYILGLDISNENKKKLVELAEDYHRKMVFIDLQDMESYFDFEFDTTGWNSIVLARLLIGKLLPADINRCLYLDGDTIVRGSLWELWNKNLHNRTLAMCAEPTVNKKRRKQLGLSDYYYHNAGVLLIDLDRWRYIGAEHIILDFYQKNNGKLFANDQDAINAALRDEIAELLPKYNFSNIYTTYPYWFIRKLVYPKKYISKDKFCESVNNPIIIHYLGEDRPWRKGNTHKYRTEYKKYLNMTVWSNAPNEEGWQLYFICWRIFNFFLKPFPIQRYWIIDKGIPIVLRYRSKKKKR